MPVMEEAALADTGAGASRLDHPNVLFVPHETGRRPQRLQVCATRDMVDTRTNLVLRLLLPHRSKASAARPEIRPRACRT